MYIKNLFLVIAMSRSGHHAVMDWIYEQFEPEKFFFNYCDFSLPEKTFDNRVQYHYNNRKYYSKISQSWMKYGTLEEKLEEFSLETEKVRNRIFNADKNLLMLNFENLNPNKLPMSVGSFASHFHPVQNTKCVLIMRDIRNLFASRIKSGRELTLENIEKKDSVYLNAIEIWKSHAREFLGITNNLPQKICVNYNRWFSDKNYRIKLSKTFCVDKQISAWNTLATYGGASSFDGKKFQDDASKMNVLQRWKEYEDNESFMSILNDQELADLSEKIFPKR